MTVIESIHVAHDATFTDRGGRRVVDHYGRPERAHRAVRNGVGLLECAYGVVVVAGDDRIEYVDNVVTNRVPTTEGRGRYALVLDPQGAIELDLYVYNAGDRLLLFTPPDAAEPLAADWAEKVFIQDVEIEVATDEFAVFGLHGPMATEKVASVFAGPGAPEERYAFVRGTIGDAGVTVARTDALTGEESYEVVCDAADAETVYDALENHGVNAAPFGHRTFETLRVEAGTPTYETEYEGRIPNVLGLRHALDFEKGCFVDQEVVSRVENRGRPSSRLAGLTLEGDLPPDSGAAVFDGDAAVGEVTRAVTSPMLDRPIALAVVEYGLEADDLTVRIDDASVPAIPTALPFVDGSERSARLPTYE